MSPERQRSPVSFTPRMVRTMLLAAASIASGKRSAVAGSPDASSPRYLYSSSAGLPSSSEMFPFDFVTRLGPEEIPSALEPWPRMRSP